MRPLALVACLALAVPAGLSCTMGGAAAREGGSGDAAPSDDGKGGAQGGGPAKAGGGGSGGGGGGPGGAAAPAKRPVAVSVDIFGETVEVAEPYFAKPGGGLLAAGGEERLKELRLFRGAHQILIEVERIRSVAVGEPADKSLILVRVTLDDGQVVEGKADRDLELRGRLRYGKYRAELARLRSVSFEERAG